MSTTHNDARNEADWDWDDWDEVNEGDEDDEMVFQPHHCDPS